MHYKSNKYLFTHKIYFQMKFPANLTNNSGDTMLGSNLKQNNYIKVLYPNQ